jgi:hypothetical protein
MGFARGSDAGGGANRPKQSRTEGELCEPEARIGFEPTCDGFANRCLTTWLPRRVFRLTADGRAPPVGGRG